MPLLAPALVVVAVSAWTMGQAPAPQTTATPSAGGVLKVAVAPLQADANARPLLPENVDDVVLQAVQVSGRFEVVGQSDIKAMLDLEAQKSLASCSADSCLNEIAAALGVDQLVAVDVAKLGDAWVVTSKLVDVKRATVIGRQKIDVEGGARSLVDGTVTAVRRLFDPTWRPPEKPLLTPSLVAGGAAGALFVAAAGSGVWALSALMERESRYDAYLASAVPVDNDAFNDAIAAERQMFLAGIVGGSLAVAGAGAAVVALVLRGGEEEL